MAEVRRQREEDEDEARQSAETPKIPENLPPEQGEAVGLTAGRRDGIA